MHDAVTNKEPIFCDFLSNEQGDSQNRVALDAYYSPNSRISRFANLNKLTGFPTQELVDAFPMADGFRFVIAGVSIHMRMVMICI